MILFLARVCMGWLLVTGRGGGDGDGAGEGDGDGDEEGDGVVGCSGCGV